MAAEVVREAQRHAGQLSIKVADRAREWANRAKRREGYEFGDLILKPVVKSFLGESPAPDQPEQTSSAPTSTVPEASPAEEIFAEYKEKTEELLKRRAESIELFQTYIPQIDARWKQLEEEAAAGTLNADSMSALLRLRGSSGVPPQKAPAVEKFQKALKDAETCPDLDAELVASLAQRGHLAAVEASLQRLWTIAEECRKCASEVGAVPCN